MSGYFALIHKEPNSCFGVTFPDFIGCISAGDTIEEAMRNAREALTAHIDFMQEDGDPIPSPSSYEAIKDACEDAVLVYIETLTLSIAA